MSTQRLAALASLATDLAAEGPARPHLDTPDPYIFLADEHKRAILEAATLVFSDEGYDGASLSKIAKVAGLSQSGLLHHFPSKELLLVAVLAMRDAEAATQFPFTEIPSLLDVVDHIATMFAGQLQRPKLIALFVKMAAEATNPRHPAHAWAVQRYALTCGFYAAMVQRDLDDGRVRADVDPQRVARNIVAAMDGLQLQYLLEPDSFDAAAEFRIYMRAVADRIRA